jgi:formylmethanofuran dehydrogenase subunit B
MRDGSQPAEGLTGACALAAAWFDAYVSLPPPPRARVDGAVADASRALALAAEILAEARLPLVYGLGDATCETAREAVAIAEQAGAVLDCAGGVLDGPATLAFATLGMSTATFGEIRDRAELVVIWRADPATTHPRLLERLRLDAQSRPAGRELVVVDTRRTATAEEGSTFIPLESESDLEGLSVLRLSVRGLPDGAPVGAGLPVRVLRQLGSRLAAARHVAFLYDRGLVGPAGGHVSVLELAGLLRDLGSTTHAVSLNLRREGNATGASAVMAWQTGFPSAVTFARGFPRACGAEFSAAALLARGEVDAALVIASDPLSHLPRSAADALVEIPTITVGARDSATTASARVAFTTAAAGLHAPGVYLRCDEVPVRVRAPVTSDLPPPEQVLRALRQDLADHGRPVLLTG